MRTCSICGKELPETEFYASKPKMCKECAKSSSRNYRYSHAEQCREYDKKRNQLPERKKAMEQHTSNNNHNIEGYKKAHNTLLRAVESGEVERPCHCAICGKECKPNAHHNDYKEPLNVVWLCTSCHTTYHIGKGGIADLLRRIVNNIFEGRKTL